jgi:hypothetical protein
MCEFCDSIATIRGAIDERNELRAQLSAVTKERDELREALANCGAWARGSVTTHECIMACQQIANEVTAALQPPAEEPQQ